jgi:hypothetical protein
MRRLTDEHLLNRRHEVADLDDLTAEQGKGFLACAA